MPKIQITSKTLPHSQVKLTISAGNDFIDPIAKQVLESHQKTYEIKGFRKGHVPIDLMVSKIGSDHIKHDILDEVLNEVYRAVLKQEKINPVAPPQLDLKSWEYEYQKPTNTRLSCELIVDLMPSIDLGDYTKVKVKPEKTLDSAAEVSDKEIEILVADLRQRRAKRVVVDRAAKLGDIVEIDFKGSIGGVPQESMTSSRHPLILGSGSFIPGFEDQLIGLERGQDKIFDITFPKDYHAAELAGKVAKFEVKVLDVFANELPPLDSEFFQALGFNDLDGLKSALVENLRLEKKQAWTSSLQNQVITELLKKLKVDLPPGLIQAEIKRKKDEIVEDIKKYNISIDQYLQSINRDKEQFEKDLEIQAIHTIKVGLMLGEVIKREKLDAQDKQSPTKALEIIIEKVSGVKLHND